MQFEDQVASPPVGQGPEQKSMTHVARRNVLLLLDFCDEICEDRLGPIRFDHPQRKRHGLRDLAGADVLICFRIEERPIVIMAEFVGHDRGAAGVLVCFRIEEGAIECLANLFGQGGVLSGVVGFFQKRRGAGQDRGIVVVDGRVRSARGASSGPSPCALPRWENRPSRPGRGR